MLSSPNPIRLLTVIGCSLALIAVTPACEDDSSSSSSAGTSSGPATATIDAVVAQYSAIVHANYLDSHRAAVVLDDSIAAFLADPTEASLTAAKDAWKSSREPYLQTEVFRFYDGPIDNPTDGPEGLLNAWPMDESHVDYTVDKPNGGIVNETSLVLTEQALLDLNEVPDETNIATGYHAVEFLLWGQDLSADSAGTRPATDYVTDGTGTAANQGRRGEYLSIASGLIVKHLEPLVAAWDPSGSYRVGFDAGGLDSLEKIMTGMIILSGFETGGERLQAAYDSQDQEDEHSCFSDNTHRDMVQDARGVANVYNGTYTKLDGATVSGPGIYDVVAEVDQALADQLRAEIAASVVAAEDLQIPFDNSLNDDAGRAKILALITALRTQESTLETVFQTLGLSVPVAE